MYDLEKLRKSTRIKIVFMSISIALPIILVLVMASLSRKYFSDYVNISVKVLTFIVLAIGEAFVITKVVRYGIILGSEKYAQKILIIKNDEREIFIRQKSAVFTIKMLFYLMLIAILVTGFLNTTIFVTLCIACGVLFLTSVITSLYYKKKY